MIRRALLLGLWALFCFPAWSQISYGSNTGYVNGAPLNSLNGSADFERFMRTATGGKADVVDRFTGRIGGKSFPVDLVRQFDKAALLRGLAKAGTRTVYGLAAAAAIKAILDRSWCSLSAEGLSCDPMQPKVPTNVYRVNPFAYWPGTDWFPTKKAAAEYFFRGYHNLSITCQPDNVSQSCSGTGYTYNAQTNTYSPVQIAVSVERATQDRCPAVPGMPGYEQPGGAPNVLGMCPVGNQAPTPEEQHASRVAPFVGDTEVEPAVRKLIEAGVDPVPSSVKTEGPAVVADNPTTRTTTPPNGQPQTTTIQNTYYVTYNGQQFSWTTTTTTTAPDGTTTEEGEKPPEKTECEKRPDSIGCMKLGDAPDDQVQKGNQALSFAAETVALPSACPAPVSLPGGRSIDYAPMCDTATKFRPFIVAAGAMTACLIVLAAVRS